MKTLKNMEKQIIKSMEKLIKDQEPENYQEINFVGYKDGEFRFMTEDSNTKERTVFFLDPYTFEVSARYSNNRTLKFHLGYMAEDGSLLKELELEGSLS